MSNLPREFAKFFSGIAAHETIGHWWLGIWGTHLLPIKFMGFTFTESANHIVMAIWPIALVALVYFAWIRPETERVKPSRSSAHAA